MVRIESQYQDNSKKKMPLENLSPFQTLIYNCLSVIHAFTMSSRGLTLTPTGINNNADPIRILVPSELQLDLDFCLN